MSLLTLGKKVPGVARKLRRVDIELLRGLGRIRAGWARETARVTNQWISTYPSALNFGADWKWLRLEVPLQTRLFVEQVLWERGGEWRKLVTGFGPIKAGAGGVPKSEIAFFLRRAVTAGAQRRGYRRRPGTTVSVSKKSKRLTNRRVYR